MNTTLKSNLLESLDKSFENLPHDNMFQSIEHSQDAS